MAPSSEEYQPLRNYSCTFLNVKKKYMEPGLKNMVGWTIIEPLICSKITAALVNRHCLVQQQMTQTSETQMFVYCLRYWLTNSKVLSILRQDICIPIFQFYDSINVFVVTVVSNLPKWGSFSDDNIALWNPRNQLPTVDCEDPDFPRILFKLSVRYSTPKSFAKSNTFMAWKSRLDKSTLKQLVQYIFLPPGEIYRDFNFLSQDMPKWISGFL